MSPATSRQRARMRPPLEASMQQLGRGEKVRLATEPKGSAAGPESPTPTSPTTCSARCWSGPSACRPGASADGAPESYPTDRETGRLLAAADVAVHENDRQGLERLCR